MRIIRSFGYRLNVISVVVLALGVLTCTIPARAQNDSADSRASWWTVSADSPRESGKLSELANKTKVYVVTSFTDSRTIAEPSPTRSADVHRLVLDAVRAHKDLQVVPLPSLADFAIVVRATATTESGDRPPNFSLALDPSTAIDVEVLVLMPGAKAADGLRRPRVVWQSSNSDAQVEAQSAARLSVDGFLWELSKLKKAAKVTAK